MPNLHTENPDTAPTIRKTATAEAYTPEQLKKIAITYDGVKAAEQRWKIDNNSTSRTQAYQPIWLPITCFNIGNYSNNKESASIRPCLTFTDLRPTYYHSLYEILGKRENKQHVYIQHN